MAKSLRFKELNLIFEKREDGGLRVRSDDVPGFVLSNSDCEAVFADIQPALETILSEMFSGDVTVGPLESIREDLQDRGILTVYAASERRTYVAQVYA